MGPYIKENDRKSQAEDGAHHLLGNDINAEVNGEATGPKKSNNCKCNTEPRR
jgi:hypothetical protein